MYNKILRNPNLLESLYKIDKDLADDYRIQGCPHCNSTLHFANYQRKPRGDDNVAGLKYSLCCSKCRRRRYVPSVLFWGRFVYVSTFFIFISCLFNTNGHRYSKITKMISVSDRTLRRWKIWWSKVFKNSGFWRDKRSAFVKPPDNYPNSILRQFLSIEKILIFFRHFHERPIILRKRC